MTDLPAPAGRTSCPEWAGAAACRWGSPATPKKTAAVLDTLGIKDGVIAYGTPITSIVFPNYRCKRLEVLPCQV